MLKHSTPSKDNHNLVNNQENLSINSEDDSLPYSNMKGLKNNEVSLPNKVRRHLVMLTVILKIIFLIRLKKKS